MEYDLIVVGTGFASTFFLKKYLEKVSSRQRILVLERGHRLPYRERLEVAMGVRADYSEPQISRQRTFENHTPEKPWVFEPSFGGGSNCWWACTPRFLPSDFRLRSLYGVGTDWPVDYDELEPFYGEAESLMGVAGPEVTPFRRSSAYPQPPHRFNAADRLMHARYGEQYVQQPTARASVERVGVSACCGTASCSLCPVNAKFTIENSMGDVYSDPRVSLVFGAQATALETSGARVQEIRYMSQGREERAQGELFALGANAIFNAHILLNSGDDNPHTGRGLCEQVSVKVGVDLRDLENTGGGTSITANGYMLYDGPARKERAACLIESSNNPLFLRIERGKWRQFAAFRFIFEDLPDQRNRVERSGDPLKPRVSHFGSSDYVRKGIAALKAQLPSLFEPLPVERIEMETRLRDTEAHVLGTTRMGKTAEQGVIDEHLIHHRWRNLFVLGGGAFPTISPSNPTLTLSALSLFAADRAT